MALAYTCTLFLSVSKTVDFLLVPVKAQLGKSTQNILRKGKVGKEKHIHTHTYIYVCICVSVCACVYIHTWLLGAEISHRKGLWSSLSHNQNNLRPHFMKSMCNAAGLRTTCFKTLTKALATCFWSFSKPQQFFLAFNEIPFYFSRYDSPWTSRAYFLLELGQLMTNNDEESIDRREILGERLNESLR